MSDCMEGRKLRLSGWDMVAGALYAAVRGYPC